MEPVDDILIPQPKRPASRLASKHVLRVLAVILMAAALAYMGKVLNLDSEKLVSHSQEDLLAIAPIFLFGVLLWWFAGRKVDELSRPLFRGKQDAPTDTRVDVRNIFWLGASLLSGLVGMGAIIIGTTFLRYGSDLKRAMPVFFQKLEQGLPQIQRLEARPLPLILAGGGLVVFSLAMLALAMRRPSRAG